MDMCQQCVRPKRVFYRDDFTDQTNCFLACRGLLCALKKVGYLPKIRVLSSRIWFQTMDFDKFRHICIRRQVLSTVYRRPSLVYHTPDFQINIQHDGHEASGCMIIAVSGCVVKDFWKKTVYTAGISIQQWAYFIGSICRGFVVQLDKFTTNGTSGVWANMRWSCTDED